MSVNNQNWDQRARSAVINQDISFIHRFHFISPRLLARTKTN